MVNEFDKEIDAMLRDLAKGDTFAQILPKKHLDADEISAFAENVLPKMARVPVTEHLADCSKCRKILANTIFLNSAEQSETIHEEVRIVVSAPVIPWYKKLFAGSNLAYSMGAMALLLVGMVGLLVLQSSNKNESMVAQSEKLAEQVSGPNAGSSEGDAYGNQPYAANTASNSTANIPSALATPALNATNSAASNAPLPKDSAPISPVGSSNSNASAHKTDSSVDDKVTDNEAKMSKKGGDISTESARKEEAKPVGTPTSETANAPNESVERRDMNKQAEISQNQTLNIQNVSPDSGNVARARTAPPSPSVSGGREQNAARPEPNKAKKMASKDGDDAKNRANETRSIGGKSFRDVNGVWTDTSYSGGSTKTVKRGSGDYKKLDSGLQNIGNSFKGTVIVVWGGKNYKIQ